MELYIIGTIIILALLLIYLIVRQIFNKKADKRITSHSILERFKEIAELSVLRAYTKEIVTESTGDKYFVVRGKKLLLICEFEIEYRYNMANIKIEKQETNSYRIIMPPFIIKVIPGPQTAYHEEKGRIFGFIPIGGLSLEERNSLSERARKNAEKQAEKLSIELTGKIENAAERTLRSLFNAVDVIHIEFVFTSNTNMMNEIKAGIGSMEVDVA